MFSLSVEFIRIRDLITWETIDIDRLFIVQFSTPRSTAYSVGRENKGVKGNDKRGHDESRTKPRLDDNFSVVSESVIKSKSRSRSRIFT